MEMTGLPVIALGLLDPLYTAFGWIMRILYHVTGNFGWVIILFTIAIRALMIPLGIKQQKSTFKQQSLQGEVAKIQRMYPNDKVKQNELQMELYKKHGASPLSGCLPSLLPLFIIWPIFRIIQAPLVHVMNVATDKIEAIASLLASTTGSNGQPLITEAIQGRAVLNNMPLIGTLNNNAGALAEVIQRGYLKMGDMINLRFLGLDLSLSPSYKPDLIFGADTMRDYLPLLVIPLLVVLTTLVQTWIMRKSTPHRKKKEEDRERERVNPARAGQSPEDKSESMMKTMNFVMPVFMLITTFSMPASMGLYWIIGNIMMIIQSAYIYFFITKRIEEASESKIGT